MYLSVIIPAYNEERRLPKTLEEIDKYLSKQTVAEASPHLPPRSASPRSVYDYEILVVNDGSKDNTLEVAKSLIPKINPSTGLRVNAERSRSIKNLKVTGYEKNQGKGYAVRFGMLEAKGDFRLFTDADNSTSIDQIEKMWPYFEKGCDIVFGSRDVKGAILDPPQSLFRRFLGEGFGFLTNSIVGTWGIADSQCGFKCFTKKATEDIFPRCKINRFAFDPEFFVIAKKLGYKIKEIPIYWRNDPESKVKFKWMVNMGLDLFKIRLNLIKGVYD